jgi:nitrogen fixation protein NifU and related proteins
MGTTMIYQEIIMHHYQHSRHVGTLENASFTSASINSSCGDSVTLQGNLHAGLVADLRFQGNGCIISQAATSLLIEHVLGKPISDVLKLQSTDIAQLLHIELGPVRMRCAMVGLEALHKGLLSYA